MQTGPSRQPVEDLLDQRQTLVDFANTNPDAGIDVTGIKHRNLEAELVIRRVLQIVPRIEGAAARTADIAAGAVLTHQRRLHKPGAHGPILERCGVVVELHELRKHFSDFSDQRAQLRLSLRRDVARKAAGHDAIHHQAMAEANVRRPQAALAQDAGLRMHQDERGVVADRADVAEVIGEPFELGHQGAQKNGARRNLHLSRSFDCIRKRKRVRDRAVAGGAPREA